MKYLRRFETSLGILYAGSVSFLLYSIFDLGFWACVIVFSLSLPWSIGEYFYSLFGGFVSEGSLVSVFPILQVSKYESCGLIGLSFLQYSEEKSVFWFGLQFFQLSMKESHSFCALGLYQSGKEMAGIVIGKYLFQRSKIKNYESIDKMG